MHLFKSREPNLVHYATSVTFNRVPIFRSDHACSLLIDALATTREKEPFKLIGYVVMPDHFHLLANPLNLDISIIVGRIKGRAAVTILSWLREQGHLLSLAKLALPRQLKSGQTHAVWMREFSAVDIWSRRFIRQKLNYIHMNPVRAGLCDHPGKWHWSSYQAYMPHEPGTVPIEVDKRWLWSEEELSLAQRGRTSALSKRETNKASEDELNSAQRRRTSALSKRETNKASEDELNSAQRRRTSALSKRQT
jgi:putative transposase